MLKWIKRTLLIIWLLFVAVLGAWLLKDNSQIVTLVLFGYELPEAKVGTVVATVLLAGVMLGFCACYITIQGKLFSKQRSLKKATKEVAALKASQAAPVGN